MAALALTVMLPIVSAACANRPPSPPPKPPPPPEVPADLRVCFGGLTEVPDRDLTVGDVERLWKDERKRSAAKTRCGERLLAWIDAILPGLR